MRSRAEYWPRERSLATLSATTNVPLPVLVTVSPRAVQERRASRITERLTPYCWESVDSELSLLPTGTAPDSMSCRIALKTASAALSRARGAGCPAVRLSDRFTL